ncbi:hypothetical protein IHE56_01475 [Streptomyces sp. ID01-12c]|uniref:Uncharacterized protein n=1 Tax=Streptomyces caniscabiei TaxID=2746961 RepID=A0A927QKM1_9ACTN|nr:hypothetical protein [Streptomyces caniscabiei]MBD9700777.1 hypothetical protein [Streptomyces caniscabiei]MBD9725067.1 hypothetical protein [Streptomyces caniscabiei]MDX3510361.1 hypothetical protein [Streptomyces caniscabiei]MDX3720445.1 hypothetical protein [Streptomyces caniscabiei]MDX3727677.1 hypothetical protein [Streptomyces caniscabiei]
MTRTGRSGNHRSKKKRITLALAPVVALGLAVPLMYSAGAATPDEVATDCRTDSDKLENCEFVDVQVKRDSLGPNERVTSVTDNCGVGTAATKTFSGTASVTRVIQLEDGFNTDGSTKLASSVFEIGVKFATQEFNIKRDDTTSSFSFSRSDTVKADHVAFFMWSHKRTDVSGFLKATYKEAQDGQKVFFSPSENATSVHVFYPQLLPSGTPDGRLWLRNVKCDTPQANGILNSEGSVRAEPGFDEGGANVTDVEIPLSEVTVQ